VAIESGAAAPALDAAGRERLRAQMGTWSVTTVVVGPMAHEDAAVAFLDTLLGAAPAPVGGVEVWWSVAP
jgi:hypothetical protein